MKRNPLTAISVIIVAVGFTIGSGLVEKTSLKLMVGIISSVPLTYQLLNLFWKNKPWIIRLNKFVRRIPIIKIFVPKDPVNEKAVNYKPAILKGVTFQCKTRLEGIKSSDFFTDDFEIRPIFIAGTYDEDTNEDWQVPILAKRFCAITGEAGSGKSFELAKRVNVICNVLNNKASDISNAVIPLYIELGTLNKELDDDWLESYIYKTYNLLHSEFSDKGIIIKREWVQAFLENKSDIIFFFDGIDEIPEAFRLDSMKYIISLTLESSVTISCRKNDYKEFNTLFFENKRTPAEYYIGPISKEQMLEVIDRLDEKTMIEKQEMKLFISEKTIDIPFTDDNETYAQKQDLINPLSRSIVFALFIKVFNKLPQKKKNELLHADINQMLTILWEYYEDFAINKMPENTDMLGLRTYAVWIAKIIQNGAFYVESIQPNWLLKVKNGKEKDAPILKGLYYISSRIIAAILVGFSLELIACTPFSLLSNSVLGGMVISFLAWVYKRIQVKKNYEWLLNLLFVIVMLGSLVGICSVYQGFSVPRYIEKGPPLIFSYNEMWPGMLLGLILCIVFSYRIVIEKKTNKYIQPVNRYQFRPIHAISYALLGGIISGLFVGAAAWYGWLSSPENLFIKNWLIPYLTDLWHKRLNIDLQPSQMGGPIFLYAFLVAFTVVGILVAILVGRYEEEKDTGQYAAGQNLRFGIHAWAGKALKRSILVFLIACGVYYSAMLILKMDNWFYLIKIALGTSVASFLWFGGIEAINHILLKLSLSARGIAPNKYDEWVNANQRMALIRPQGYKMAFYHPTLMDYYKKQKLENNPRIRVKTNVRKDAVMLGVLTLFFFTLLFLPFAMRYWWNSYWQDPYHVYVSQKDIEKADWRKQKDGIYQIQKSETVILRAHGFIQVGTFVGLVLSPAGTNEGYMGMPLKTLYNWLPDTCYSHAALLVRKSCDNGNNWEPYKAIQTKDRDSLPITIESGNLLQFVVNDKEYQNNLGSYTVTIDHEVPPRKQKPVTKKQ